MHPLDIISDSPNFFILQKESNKTNFGGFLIILYFITMLIICIFYGVKYKLENTYEIQSLIHFNIKSEIQKAERRKSKLFNPTLKFMIDLTHYNNTSLNDKFKIYDLEIDDFINRKKLFKKNVSEFKIQIVYECEDFNCSDYYNSRKNDFYYLETVYEGFQLDHQHPKEPIQKKCKNKDGKIEDCYFAHINQLEYNSFYHTIYYWKNIHYIEKKLFKKDYNKSCGYIEYDDINKFSFATREIKGKTYFILNYVTINTIYTEYLEYNRKENTILDLIANIFSFISNIFFGLRLIFKYYSKNFNNFKIIEKIMTDKRKNNLNCVKSDKSINTLLQLESHNNEKNNGFKKFMPLTDDIKITEELINDIKDFENIEDDEIDEMRQLKKLHFFDFFLNNLYINKICKKRKPQKIINACNKILYKYASIDTIVYNQILIENLLKDYKWNDPSLNNPENNSLFNELKTYL